ncbi:MULTISPECIES: DUF357 domain-containing protein [Acidiplasma]|jgi:hypothetical protein|uniref:DUF357 domain-containing protein n=2 Tax=Acidiplasma TaxID=507753 RepID=A0A0Q0RJE6_9ARCH|nr:MULTISPECIES: DUF357 domain-containing protein [Acidiplasma]KJE49473.1 hypothetical protein TZ01_05505 [Acidiplasma sp. MBA-1]KPV46696.1 hypothetical protein SE19_04410 [Acidiplasma aeolicum]KQB35538.1 hypothetical protein AOG55_06505 [Acidiplasma cupricumulans]KQB36713.1 hypothetical protein AOG54_00060 [Acidiplasma aeolicum]WMT54546.1 MAG: DUF357 domain-containing protein [Acidiplasma sp.]
MELENRVKKYFAIEEEALKKVKISVPKESHLYQIASDHLEMVKNYYNDARYFYEKNDLINAFAALNYSYGWLDSGIRLGIFTGGPDYRLFTQFR